MNWPINVASDAQIALQSLFFTPDQPMHMCSPKQESLVTVGTGAFKSNCNDAMTL